MVFRITLLEIILRTFRTFRYRLASILSTSYRFQRPAATIGVPKYMSMDLDKQQTSYCMTSESALPSRHLITLTFFSICSLATFVCSFLSTVTLTPRYLTILVHLTPPISVKFSLVRISDFFLFSSKFQFEKSYASSLKIISTSC